MSYGNRSKEYDWFKGGKDQKGKDAKSTFKTIWRFTKIFLMFSLFFFSMWGCVQVFVIKINNHVGDGVEFYNSEAEIAPHVTEIAVTDANGVYSVNLDDKNVWLNKSETNAELKATQKVLTDGGHKMSDAFKGKNEYVRVLKNGVPQFDKGGVIAQSSEQKKYRGTFTGGYTGLQTLYRDGAPMQIQFDAHHSFAGDLVFQLNALTDDSIHSSANPHSKVSMQIFDIMKNYLHLTGDTDYSTYDKFTDLQKVTTEKIGKFAYVTGTGNGWYKFTAASPPTTAVASWVKQNQVPTTIKPLTITAPNFRDTHYRPIITWKQAWVRGVGPFYGLFVFPIAKMGVSITNGLGMNHGWESLFAIIIIVFILRILAFGLTFKSVLQQTKQQEVQSKKAVIDAKYANYKGNKQMESRKRQETADLYKKEGISPLGALGTVFITMPIFLSIWRVIGGVPHLKSTIWLGINFSSTSYKELFKGEFQYLPLLLLAAASAAFSQIYPRLLTKRRDKNRINVHQKTAMKKNNKTQNIIMVVYVVMAVIFSAGIQIYWIVGGIWQVIQATITHRILIRARKKSKNRVKV